MFYIILTAIFAAGWYLIGHKERVQIREKERQAALWKMAGINELFYRREYQ